MFVHSSVNPFEGTRFQKCGRRFKTKHEQNSPMLTDADAQSTYDV